MNKLIELHAKGLNDAEIGEIMNISSKKVFYERTKLKLKSNFSYLSTRIIDYKIVGQLVKDGLSDVEISKKLNISKDTIYGIRIKSNFNRPSFCCDKKIDINNRQMEILTGTLLGDSSLRLGVGAKNPSFSCEHGKKQLEYCFHKFKEFESIEAKFKTHIRKTIDKRTGIFYESETVKIGAKTNFMDMYKNLYILGKKRITKEFLINFSEISLAYLFMDDGSKYKNGYCLALMSFEKEDLEILRIFFINKFGIDFSIYKNGLIYIPSKFKTKFTELTLQYIHPTMMYKMHV